jgi:hypothetical protein
MYIGATPVSIQRGMRGLPTAAATLFRKSMQSPVRANAQNNSRHRIPHRRPRSLAIPEPYTVRAAPSGAPVRRRSRAGAPERRTLVFYEITDFSKIGHMKIFNSGNIIFLIFPLFCHFPRRRGHVSPSCTLSWCGGSVQSLFAADWIANAARPAFARSSFSRGELLG